MKKGKCVMVFILATMLFALFVPGGASAAAGANVSIDYAVNTVQGSPYVFGFNKNPLQSQASDVFPKLQDIGMTRIRNTAYLDKLNMCSTIAAWNANTGNCTDPNNWDWSSFWWVSQAKANNMKVSMIFAYAPAFLTYSGDIFGIPQDWSIYEDVVKKIYTKYQSDIDWVEILNEPNASWFLNLTGSGYSDAQTAIKDFYYHIAKAIRTVNPTVPMGGLSSYGMETANLAAVLDDTRIPHSSVNFGSFHEYSRNAGQIDINPMKSTFTTRGYASTVPIMVTEFNTEPSYLEERGFNSGSWLGLQLSRYIKQGYYALDYYAAFPSYYPLSGEPYFSPSDMSNFGMYTWNNATSTSSLLPMAYTYKILSKKLGLGAGAFNVNSTTVAGIDDAFGATNASGTKVAFLANNSAQYKNVNITFKNTGLTGPAQVSTYMATFRDFTNTGESVYQTSNKTVVSGQIIETVTLAPFSVAGLIVKSGTPDPIASPPAISQENLMKDATLTASSQFSNDYTVAKANDGMRQLVYASEWASNGQTNPWIQLTWPTAQNLNRIVLNDRTNSSDNVNGGTLTFSDGTSQSVTGIPTDGSGKTITFATKNVTWVKFQASGGSGTNNGLLEFQAYESTGTLGNIGIKAAVSTSSDFSATYGAVKANDNLYNFNENSEWASNGEVNPWIKASWVQPVSLNKIVLYDRSNLTDNVNGGTLTFSDGSSVAVTGIPKDGSPLVVNFTARLVTWAKFQAAGGSGVNAGLAELEAYGANPMVFPLPESNLAPAAVVTASSQYNASYSPDLTLDGIVQQGDVGEWASLGQTNPWIQLNWNSSKTINKVVLFDRPNTTDNANNGTLTFSDGTSVPVAGIPTNGAPLEVVFPSKNITWMKFQVSGGSGPNVGLSEIQATNYGTNVALSANGGTATASSSLSASYPASSVINGDRKGLNWTSGGGWSDSTFYTFPDWLQIDFSGTKTINEIDVYTLQNNYSSPADPTDTMLFSTGGATAYTVQYWNGTAWRTVPGGSVTGNTNVGRRFMFAPISTTKIRITVNGSADNYASRLVEVEAWSW